MLALLPRILTPYIGAYAGDEGAIALAKVLQDNKSLTEINLCSNDIADSGAQVCVCVCVCVCQHANSHTCPLPSSHFYSSLSTMLTQ